MAWIAKDEYEKEEEKKAVTEDEKEIIRRWREKRLKQSYKKYHEFNLYCCSLDTLKSFVQTINFMVLLQMVIASLSVFLCQQYNITFDMPVHLFISPIVFPLAFAINTDFHRREKVLEDLAVFKSSGMVWYHCMREWRVAAGLDIDWLNSVRDVIKSLLFHLCEYLVTSKHERRVVIIRTMYKEFSRANGLIEKIRDSKLPTNSAIISRSVHLLYCMCLSFERLRVIREYRSPRAIRSLNKIFIVLLPIILAPYFCHKRENKWEPYFITLPVTFVFSALQAVQDKLDDPFDGMGEDDINLEDVDVWSMTTLDENPDRSFDVGRFKVSISSERIFMESADIVNMPDKEKLKSLLTPILEGMSGQTQINKIKKNSNVGNSNVIGNNNNVVGNIEINSQPTLGNGSVMSETKIKEIKAEEKIYVYNDEKEDHSMKSCTMESVQTLVNNHVTEYNDKHNDDNVATNYDNNPINYENHVTNYDSHVTSNENNFDNNDDDNDNDNNSEKQNLIRPTTETENDFIIQIFEENHDNIKHENPLDKEDQIEVKVDVNGNELIDIRIEESFTPLISKNNKITTNNRHNSYVESSPQRSVSKTFKKSSLLQPPLLTRKINSVKSLDELNFAKNYTHSCSDLQSVKDETIIPILSDDDECELSAPLKRRCSSHSDITFRADFSNELRNFHNEYRNDYEDSMVFDHRDLPSSPMTYLPLGGGKSDKCNQLQSTKNGIFNLFENIKCKSKSNVYSSFVTSRDYVNTIDVFPV